MTSSARVAQHRSVQNAAKAALSELAETIRPQDTEHSIALRAANAMRDQGAPETWYYDCPALVLLGSRSCESPSGRDYQPAFEPVGETNLITVDLSPKRGSCWGDCARSFFMEEGRLIPKPTRPEFALGAAFLVQLHSSMRTFARPETPFHELAVWTERQIQAAGFVNLDFRRNVGHSIATRREDRQYIKEGNRAALGDVDFFTFEPHVRAVDGVWGFKHEDIFYFESDGRLEVL